MSSVGYVQAPIVTDARVLMQRMFAYMVTKNPGWTPNEPNLSTWMFEAFGNEAADIATLASGQPKAIYRFIGSKLFGIDPINATSATTTSTWYFTDDIGHTVKAGTNVGILDGFGVLQPFKVLYDVIVAGGLSNTPDDAVVLIAVDPGSAGHDLGSTLGVVQLVDQITWIDHITQTAATLGGTDAETDDDYLDRITTDLQTMSPRPILAADFSLLARNIPGIQRCLTIDNYNPNHNLLTANEASAEIDDSDWGSLSNTTVSSTGVESNDGSLSVQMTAASAADMSMVNDHAYDVVPGDTITATATFRAATTSRACKVGIYWEDSSNVFISTSYGATAADTLIGWTQATVTAQAPPLAAKCRVVCFVTSPANAEIHYADDAMLRRGTSVVWVKGGSPEFDNERMVCMFPLDNTGTAVGGTIKTALNVYMQALREQNYLVNIADAVHHEIDVTCHHSVLPGWQDADVSARVATAISNYLASNTWGINVRDNPNDPKTWINKKFVYYLELAAAINRVGGLDQINLLEIGPHGGTLASEDFPLGDAAPITVPGTITVAVA